MTAKFSGEELIQAACGEWLNGKMPEKPLAVYTDSRVEGRNSMFLALTGEKFDGHDFLSKAIENGAEALCISAEKKIPADCPVPVLMVNDTLEAYQKIANFHRRRFPELRMAAVTGSVGKTSVKEMLRAIFTAAAGYESKVLYTVGNTNNQVGVPQNLLRLTPEHTYAVIEMGTNSPGEIEPLSRCAEPQTAVVNSIAPCHLELLGSLEGIAEEKAKIWTGMRTGVTLPKTARISGVAVFPHECPGNVILASQSMPFRALRFGTTPEADVRGEYISGDLNGSTIRLTFPDGRSTVIEWAMTGEHQACNGAAAAATALALGIAPEVITAGLKNTSLPGMRMARSEKDGVIYINDAYNANPQSMAAALKMLSGSFPNGKGLIAVLGDMLELGNFEEAGHRETLETALRLLPESRIAAVGKRMSKAAEAIGSPANVYCCENAEKAGDLLKKIALPGNTVFLKGSRGMALEKALP